MAQWGWYQDWPGPTKEEPRRRAASCEGRQPEPRRRVWLGAALAAARQGRLHLDTILCKPSCLEGGCPLIKVVVVVVVVVVVLVVLVVVAVTGAVGDFKSRLPVRTWVSVGKQSLRTPKMEVQLGSIHRAAGGRAILPGEEAAGGKCSRTYKYA
eukprot:s1551_g17.t1